MFSQEKHNIYDSLASEILLYLLIKLFIVHIMSVFYFKDLFILAALGLCCCVWVSSLVEVLGLLTALAFLVVGHRL